MRNISSETTQLHQLPPCQASCRQSKSTLAALFPHHACLHHSPSSSRHSSPPWRSAAAAAGSRKWGEPAPKLPAVARCCRAGDWGSLRAAALLLRLQLLAVATMPAGHTAAELPSPLLEGEAGWLPLAEAVAAPAAAICCSLNRRECRKDAVRHVAQSASHTEWCLLRARPTSPSM